MLEKHRFWKRNIHLLIGNMTLALLWMVLNYLYEINIEYLFYVWSFLVIETIILMFVQYKAEPDVNEDKEEATEMVRTEERRQFEKLKEKEDFFVLWAHQIKTPIAAMNLLLQDEETDIAGCRRELFKIENYVELALNYTRFENISKDLVLEKCALEPMVRQIVKKYSTVFIHKHLKVELKDLEVGIMTDEKWFCFVLEQLLSNALKYTNKGGIRIYTNRDGGRTEVVIKDSGVGIRSEDMPRIFEKGFTGYNGRSDKKASGIGLYLCKGVCDKLGHGIKVESVEGKGTKIILDVSGIPEQADLTKM